MRTIPERISRGAPATTAESPTSFPDDQLYMLKLCLELQLEAMLLALGSSAVVLRGGRRAQRTPGAARPADLPWEKWLAEDVELACALTRDCVNDGIPLPSSMGQVDGHRSGTMVESLAARYSAMSAVVGNMLDRTDPEQHATAFSRLVETRTRCEERLAALIGGSPETTGDPWYRPAEPGHFLG